MLQIRREEHTTPSLHGSDELSPLSALFLELVQSGRCFTNTKKILPPVIGLTVPCYSLPIVAATLTLCLSLSTDAATVGGVLF